VLTELLRLVALVLLLTMVSSPESLQLAPTVSCLGKSELPTEAVASFVATACGAAVTALLTATVHSSIASLGAAFAMAWAAIRIAEYEPSQSTSGIAEYEPSSGDSAKWIDAVDGC
jgi:hypothetical protein